MQFHVNPASTRPRSSTSLRKHRGRGDFSGSSSRSHDRESELRRSYDDVVVNLSYDVITLNYDQNELRRKAQFAA